MTQKRVELFDTVKGIMILFIIIAHFHWVYPDDYLRYGFVFYIDMAVPVLMTLTGYFYALSAQRAEIHTIQEAYKGKLLLKKLLRFLVPFVIACLIELPYLLIKQKCNIIQLFFTFVRGGHGPGAYYTPIMIQTIFLAPVLFCVIKRFDFKGFLICFAVTGLYELISYCLGIPDELYKFIVFRYISTLSFGIFIAIGKKQFNHMGLLFLFVLGVLWQAALNYIPIAPIFMNHTWARVNYLSSIPAMLAMYILIKARIFDRAKQIHIPFIHTWGKASFNIYLTQMVVYGCGLSDVVYGNIPNSFVQLLVIVTICLAFGWAFYKLESRITNTMISKIGK